MIDAPLALAEERASKLRRIYANAGRDIWDGPTVFRAAMEKHGGIQLSAEKRTALAHILVGLMWGELAAWIVAAELAERLEDPDSRMAASSQVFDEARHFYTLRDYLAALHVPVPRLDPYNRVAIRRLLGTRDLIVKLFAMQILAEGAAVVIFRFLTDSKIEPVLNELLPYFEKDEARHVGLGVVALPDLLKPLSRRKLMHIRAMTHGIGDLFGAAQVRNLRHYQLLGADPRDLIRAADKMLYELGEKIGRVPGTDLRFFSTNPVTSDSYENDLDLILPRPGKSPGWPGRIATGVIEFGARVIA
jgi:hypothetical protein